jgi:uncharacterized protein YdaU (DUF1376 family)
MSQPWFPFYVGDYLRDTARLSTEGHGAYLLLILDYWANGAPPDEDETLASIARLQLPAWLAPRQKLAGFFQIEGGKWTHKRIDREREVADEKHRRRVEAGRQGGEAKGKQSSGNSTGKAKAKPCQPQPQSQSDGGVERAREPAPPITPDAKPKAKSLIGEEAHTIAGEVLEAMGKDPFDPICVGAPLMVQSWLNGGWGRDCILAGVKLGMQSRQGAAPSTLKYFEKAIARAQAELFRPLPKAEINKAPTVRMNAHGSRNSIIQAADRLVDTLRSFDAGADELEPICRQRARLLFGCFRRGEANEPETFVTAIAAVLARYPEDVIRDVTHPATGLAVRCDFLPTVAEVYRACETIMRPRREAEAWRQRVQQQLEERTKLERGRKQ